ncbi:MAG: hypothetical protein ACREMY_29955, partial [bacterium]
DVRREPSEAGGSAGGVLQPATEPASRVTLNCQGEEGGADRLEVPCSVIAPAFVVQLAAIRETSTTVAATSPLNPLPSVLFAALRPPDDALRASAARPNASDQTPGERYAA